MYTYNQLTMKMVLISLLTLILKVNEYWNQGTNYIRNHLG